MLRWVTQGQLGYCFQGMIIINSQLPSVPSSLCRIISLSYLTNAVNKVSNKAQPSYYIKIATKCVFSPFFHNRGVKMHVFYAN